MTNREIEGILESIEDNVTQLEKQMYRQEQQLSKMEDLEVKCRSLERELEKCLGLTKKYVKALGYIEELEDEMKQLCSDQIELDNRLKKIERL